MKSYKQIVDVLVGAGLECRMLSGHQRVIWVLWKRSHLEVSFPINILEIGGLTPDDMVRFVLNQIRAKLNGSLLEVEMI